MAWWLLGAVASALGSAGAAVGGAVGSAAGAVGGAVGGAAGAVGGAAQAAGGALMGGAEAIGSGIQAAGGAIGEGVGALQGQGGVVGGITDGILGQFEANTAGRLQQLGVTAAPGDTRNIGERVAQGAIDRGSSRPDIEAPEEQTYGGYTPEQPQGRSRVTAMPPRYGGSSRTMSHMGGDRDYGGGRMLSRSGGFSMPPVWDPGGYFDEPRVVRVPMDAPTDETGHTTVPIRAVPGEIVGGSGGPGGEQQGIWTDRMTEYANMPPVKPDYARHIVGGFLTKQIGGITGAIRRDETGKRRGRLADYLEEVAKESAITPLRRQRYEVMASRLDVDPSRISPISPPNRVRRETDEDGFTQVYTDVYNPLTDKFESRGDPVLDTSVYEAGELMRTKKGRDKLIDDWEWRVDEEMYELYTEAYPFNQQQGGDFFDTAGGQYRATPSNIAARQRYEDYKKAVLASGDDELIQRWLDQNDRLMRTQLGDDVLIRQSTGAAAQLDPVIDSIAGLNEGPNQSFEQPMLPPGGPVVRGSDNAAYGQPIGQSGGLTGEDPRMTGEAPVAGSASTHNRKRRDTVDRQIIDLERALYTSSSPGREDEIEAKLSQLYAERENLGPSTLEHNVGAIGDTLGAIPGQVESGVEAVMQPIASGLTSTARFIRDMKPAIEGAVGGAFSGAQGAFGPGSGVNRILGDAGRPANNELRSAGDAALSEPGRQARREQVETPLTFADPATVSSYAPTDNQVAPREVHQYLTQTHGMSDNHAAGMLANIQQESSFNAGAYNPNDVGMPSGGFFQHRADRLEGLTGAAGDWSQNWQGQIDFALSEPAGKRYLQMDFATPEDAAEWFVRHFEIPGKMEEQVDIRRGHVKRFSQFGA